jgi:hypothetical protein
MFMTRMVEAVIDRNGNVHLLEAIKLDAAKRALVFILDGEPARAVSETARLSEQALAEDWSRPEEAEAWAHLQLA